jgi:hypothetical protein
MGAGGPTGSFNAAGEAVLKDRCAEQKPERIFKFAGFGESFNSGDG